MKDMAMESNIPQIPERIMVNGDKSQNLRAQMEALWPVLLEETDGYRRYATAKSPRIIGCLSRK